MRKIALLFLVTFLLPGCATYKFQKGNAPYDKGYVVSRDDYQIPEYTLGKDNKVPQTLDLAEQRFKERRRLVEHYYKKMGLIENHFKMVIFDPCIYFLKMIKGVFSLPFVYISDRKMEKDPAYKERVFKKQDEKDLIEEVRVKKLKEELNIHIQKELNKEG
ncbi:MAG: hypothetical protein JW788_05165 [Candidatus Omnitrophica bacterium]|nr:hypothetical protein [Candidatus Omnitrophota bacterium]